MRCRRARRQSFQHQSVAGWRRPHNGVRARSRWRRAASSATFPPSMCTGPTPCEHGWAKVLPETCPPAETSAPADGMQVYRTAKQFPPSDEDFKSLRELEPTRTKWGGKDCQSRSVSVWSTVQLCAQLLKLPRHNHKRVVQLELTASAGAIQQDSNGHISWWQCKAFDAIAASSEATP